MTRFNPSLVRNPVPPPQTSGGSRPGWLPPLLAEHFVHDTLDQPAIDWLTQRDVSAEAVMHPWSIMMTRVCFDPDGTFERDPAGSRAFTLVIEDGGEVIDLSAWDPRTGRLASYLGHAFALGQDRIFDAATYAFDGALRVHRSPLSWLQAGREGIVILRPQLAYAWLGHVERLEAEDEAHALELWRMVEPPAPRVEIMTKRRTARKASPNQSARPKRQGKPPLYLKLLLKREDQFPTSPYQSRTAP